MRILTMAEAHGGCIWGEDTKVECLGLYLKGEALAYYNKKFMEWWTQHPSLDYILYRLHEGFTKRIPKSKGMKLMMQRKDTKRSWKEHYLYLIAVSEAIGGAPDLVLENIVTHAAPHLGQALMGKYQPRRTDYLQHAEELVNFAEMIENNKEHDAVNFTEPRRCAKCNRTNHTTSEC